MILFSVHCLYIVSLFIYITEIYTLNHVKNRRKLLILMSVGNVISLLYDTYQLYDHGIVEYFSSFYNWFDFIYIWSGAAFIVISFINDDPYIISLKMIMMLIILCSIIRTLFFMRIITSLTWLVTLMK
jgi:CDP-diglyceride synthetase